MPDAAAPHILKSIMDGQSALSSSELGLVLLVALALGVLFWNRKLRRETCFHRDAATTLSSEEQTLRLTLEAVTDAVWDLNVPSDRVYRSESWWRMLGYVPREHPVRNSELEDLLHPEDLASFRACNLAHIVGETDSFSMEFRLKTAEGQWLWVHSRGAAVERDAKGQAIRIIGSHTNIHARKTAEQAILEHKQLLENIVSTLPLQVYWKDDQLRYLGCNWQFILERGLKSPESVRGLTDADLSPSLENAPRQALERMVVETGEPVLNMQERSVTPAGEARLLQVKLAPLHRADGSLLGVLGICTDITDQNALENALHEAKNKADAANEAKSQFLAAMSHEIRTPMNAIMGMTEMLVETPLNQEQMGFVQVLATAGEALMAIINNILDISRAESGQMPVDNAPFRLEEVQGRMTNLFALRARTKGLDFSFTVDPALSDPLVGDVLRLQQIITNLLENAIKFTESGAIRVSASLLSHEETAEVLFEVTDTGVGIPKEKQASVFERFVQADASTTRQYGGSGLGLALCKELVTLMGGRIWLESEVGEGASFFFTLPFAAYVGAAPSAASPTDNAEERPLVQDSCKLLLVEDSEYNAFVVASYLRGADCKITLARNGEEGVRLFSEQPFDLIFMDMQMPVMDGYSATRAIRTLESKEGRAPTPIVAMTAHAFAEERERSLEAGCNAHLVKPVSRRALLDAIQAHTGKQIRRLHPPGGRAKEVNPRSYGLTASGAELDALVCDPPYEGEDDGVSPIPICVDPEIKAIAPQFLAAIRAKISPYLQEIKPEDLQEISRLGHQLKGEGAAFGFPSLGDQGMQLEIAAGQGDSGAAQSIMQRMVDFLDRIVLA